MAQKGAPVHSRLEPGLNEAVKTARKPEKSGSKAIGTLSSQELLKSVNAFRTETFSAVYWNLVLYLYK